MRCETTANGCSRWPGSAGEGCDGFLEGLADLGGVTTPFVGEADQGDSPVGLAGARTGWGSWSLSRHRISAVAKEIRCRSMSTASIRAVTVACAQRRK